MKIVVTYLPGGDHAAVDFMTKLAQPQSSAEKGTVYHFKRADFEQFHNLFSTISQDACLWGGDSEDSWQRFMAKIQRPPINLQQQMNVSPS